MCAGGLIWLAAQQSERAEVGPAVILQEAQDVFPLATRLGPRDLQRNSHKVFDKDGELLGVVLKTSPSMDDLVGYSGPSNVLIALSPDGSVRRVKLLSSDDTPAHVEQVARDIEFWRQVEGWSPTAMNLPELDAVSGSTLTSLAILESIHERLGAAAGSLRFPQPVTLDEVLPLFPAASKLEVEPDRHGWSRVLGSDHATLGFVVRTSPQADNIIGYRGPTEALVAVDADRRQVRGVRLRSSFDTEDYVQRVSDDGGFLATLAESNLQQWAEMDFRAAGIEGVSGATQTSFAVAEGIRRTAVTVMESEEEAEALTAPWHPRDVGLLLVVVGSLIMGFSKLRRKRWLRRSWQVILIVGFGLWFGDLVSLALMAGWARHGLPLATAPVLVLLVAVALLVPWGTKRQVYCHHLCPHGAAQEWLGSVRRFRLRLPQRAVRWLQYLPAALLCIAFLLAVTVVRFDLSKLEPFDAWTLRSLAFVSFVIAVVGLLASVFVTQAYCRFGCPTGALLKFVRSHGSTERFGARDWLALAMLCLGVLVVLPIFGTDLGTTAERNPDARGPRLAGEAFGTTWSVKLRDVTPNAIEMRDEIQAELDRIERQLSHWRPESETTQFNSSETTLELEYSSELVSLVEHVRLLGEATAGAYDITAGPLIEAWGYGPAGPRRGDPTAEELQQLLAYVGWDKLQVQSQWQTLRKEHPLVQIDLGSLLQGYAVDRVASLLENAGVSQYLIDVGGELRAGGTWTVGILDPLNTKRTLRTVQLSDAALATSGVYRRAPVSGAGSTRHIISPRTGRATENNWLCCSVIAPTCLEADGWATALMATATDDTLVIANREGIDAILVDRAGKELQSASEAERPDGN